MKDLSNGFDLAAEISEDVCEYIFRMAYWSDLPTGIPDFVSHTDPGDPADIIELYFGVPSLQFIQVGDLQNAVKITFPFTARVFPETVEASAIVTVIMAATLRDNVIVVDFVDAPDQFRISDAFPRDVAVLEARVKPLLVTTLFQKLKGRPISPPVSASIPFFTFRTYIVPPTAQQSAPSRLLGVLVNRTNTPAAPPGMVEAWIQNDPYRPMRPQRGIAIAIPVEIVLPIIQKSLAAQGFASTDLPKTSPTDSTITINSLSLTLQQGHIRIVGNATKEIDVLPDPDVDFEVLIGLWIQDGALQINVLHVNADLPWWASALHFVIPFVGTVILDIIRQAVIESIGNAVGGVAQGAVSEIAAFGSDLPNAGGLVKVTNTGSISIRPTGLIIPGQAQTIFNPRAIKSPDYIFGNYETKEFHKRDCAYYVMMKAAKRTPFINPLQALRRGYNGCNWCYPEFNNPHPGRVVFHLSDPSADVNFVGSIEGARAAPDSVGGLSVVPTINLLSNFALSPRPRWWQIATGEWKFILTSDDDAWRAECVVQIPRLDPNGVLHISATRGKPNCNHALGAAPPFP